MKEIAEATAEKLSLESLAPGSERFEQLRVLYPDAFVEGKLDADKLRQILGEDVETGPERYGLTWAGKSDAIKSIQSLSTGTLLPCRDESINFDSTENVIIEGDNLEVLKLLQRSYYGKIKMIYIDPPYNTGGEFIYPDNYKEGLQEYLRFSGQISGEGIKLTTNPETSGRYHSRWLTMMYPRLFLARNLLREDGVIFVSIDDHEVHNLRSILNEIFGEEHFVATFVWEKRTTRENRRVFSFNHDYVICYARDKDEFETSRNLLPLSDEARARYSNPDNDSRGDWQSVSLNAQAGHATKEQFYSATTPSGRIVDPPAGRCWSVTKTRMEDLIRDSRVWFGERGNNVPRRKVFLSEAKEGLTPHTLWTAKEVGTTDSAKKKLIELFDGVEVFDTPKPTELLQRISQIAMDSRNGDIALDFFAGSATTADAVLRLNERDGGDRRFILVQLPEPTGREDYKTIADICKERVRRVIKKLNEADAQGFPAEGSSQPDRAFQVFKLSSSNFKIWDPETTPKDEKKLAEQLKLMVHNVVDNRGDDDLLYELILKSGLPLTSTTEKLTVAGLPALNIENGTLIICLARPISQEALREIIALNPQRVLCLDVAFAGNDQLKTNIVLEMKSHAIEFRTV